MHTIRLRGPWEIEAVAKFELQPDGSYRAVRDGLPTASRATMPADWSQTLGADFLGRVQYRRTFHMPAGLGASEQVWLVAEPLRSRGRIELNGASLGEVSPHALFGRFNITDVLQEHNRLTIEVEHPALDASGNVHEDSDAIGIGGLVGEVRLEIEE
jgi:hypothetical protein